MSKFNSALAEFLYGEEPSESIGSVDELGWYGLFLNEALGEVGGTGGGQILTEDSNGFVTVWEYATDLELNDEWHQIESDYLAYDEQVDADNL